MSKSTSDSPLYLQVANTLLDQIRDGRWRPSEALPSERRLADLLNVSRVTARKAIAVLCERGMMTRKRGSGNYIAPAIEQRPSHLTSFSSQMWQRGVTPGSVWLSREIAHARAHEVIALGLAPDAMVARLKRLRTADGAVIAIECSTVPAEAVPSPGAVEQSLYDYLSDHGLHPARALQHIAAVSATAEQAALAHIEEGAAMLFITRVSYLENGKAIELTHSHFLSDYYEFVAELRYR